MKKQILILSFLLVFPFQALMAQEAAQTAPTPPLPAPIQNLVNGGAQARYLGDDYGLQSWLTIKNGQEQYFYVLPGGKAFVMGVLFDEKGKLVTVDQVQRLRNTGDKTIDALAEDAAAIAAARENKAVAGQKPLSASEQMFSDVESANMIFLGADEAPPVYAFIDPQCPHCHAFIQALRNGAYLDKGQVQLRVIPVGFKPDTAAQAAYLMAAPDPGARLLAHLDGDKNALPVKEGLSDEGVRHNVAIMQSWKMDATPFIIYRARNGQVKILRGEPKDMAAFIKDLPAKPVPAPTSAVVDPPASPPAASSSP